MNETKKQYFNLIDVERIVWIVICILYLLAKVDIKVLAVAMIIRGVVSLICVFKNNTKKFWIDLHFWTGLCFIIAASGCLLEWF
jgi:hypothetical protein